MKISRAWLLAALCMAASVYAGKPVQFSALINPSFGDLLGGAAGRTFILGTDGTISGPNAGEYLFGAVAGSVHIVGQADASIDILATNFSADGGVSIANVTCNYGGAGDQDCDVGFTGLPPKPQGQTMAIGLEITTTQVHGDNVTASPGYDIVINYI